MPPPPDLLARHNLRVAGHGATTLLFVHGYGCGQAMWRFVAPALAARHRVVLMDLAGHGGAAPGAWDPVRHAGLEGHAQDVVEVAEAVSDGQPVVLVGHSVGAMIGLLAHLRRPELFAAHAMVAPSPCFLEDGEYRGGFSAQDLEGVLDALEENQLAWAQAMAPTIMGADQPAALVDELADSFCSIDTQVARQFARATFCADVRAQLPALDAPVLLVQCSEDALAPRAVGDYMQHQLPRATLQVIPNAGHCPHLSAPEMTAAAIGAFLAGL